MKRVALLLVLGLLTACGGESNNDRTPGDGDEVLGDHDGDGDSAGDGDEDGDSGDEDGGDDAGDGDGAPGCPANTYGPSCTACNCNHGTCDDGITGTGTCVCNAGWEGASCDGCLAEHYGPTCAPWTTATARAATWERHL